jgi:hypothetical protein
MKTTFMPNFGNKEGVQALALETVDLEWGFLVRKAHTTQTERSISLRHAEDFD